MDRNKEKSEIGMKISMKLLENEGYECTDVSKIGKDHKGYDFSAKKDNEKIKIEVKATEDESKIPDCYVNEFDKDRKIIADFLYIVRLDKDLKPKEIEVLSKEDVDMYSDTHKKTERIRISSRLITDLKKGKVGSRKKIDQIFK